MRWFLPDDAQYVISLQEKQRNKTALALTVIIHYAGATRRALDSYFAMQDYPA